jgi:4a-hydroxytetrahydrobiopterin dehydratase
MTWIIKKEKLAKDFEFKSFIEAISFVNAFTPFCEKMTHHPDFKVFNYKYISFELYTHDTKSISKKDYELATELDKIYGDIVN